MEKNPYLDKNGSIKPGKEWEAMNLIKRKYSEAVGKNPYLDEDGSIKLDKEWEARDWEKQQYKKRLEKLNPHERKIIEESNRRFRLRMSIKKP